ncbi:MAG: trypsin-like peptidase domain-containing protein [Spirochaetaceae bacterium]|jgi:S1-C subfamily serine protease|nr:trypsin-like peptidase domain-containing protein [Spirochaetaceae bacterium]
MRLYNRRELFFYLIITALAVSLFMVGLGFFQNNHSNQSQPPQDISQSNLDAFDNQELSRAIPVQTQSEYSPDEWENIYIYEELNDAVVNITTVVLAYNFFLEAVPQEGGSGSGTIIDKDGIILTNNHVIKNAQKVFITLSDGTQFEGHVIGSDPENDLSLVQFDPDGRDLQVIPFGDSTNLRVGQKVLAIGNPYGLERTLTTGIVSGLGRPLKNDEGHVIRDMIQSDASINPGNSGGPLLNSRGKMIGINTMIYSPNGGSVGLGFSVPIETAKRVVPDLISYGEVIRGWIDVEPLQLFPSLVRYAKLTTSQGILVSRVNEGSLAQQAGLRGGNSSDAVRSGSSVIYLGGDIIIEINGLTINNFTDYYSALEDTRPGDIAEVTVMRGRRTVELEVELSKRP